MNEESRTTVRRRDRAVEDDGWIERVLRAAGSGVLATVSGGEPFLNSNLFVYDPARRAIFMHTARLGRTRAHVEAHPRVCFTVFELGRLLPADTALEFSCEYASVAVFGTGRIVTDPDEQRDALQALLDKYVPDRRPGRDYRPITDEELARTSVFRVDVEEWIGKRKRVEDDFPHARPYHAPPLVDLAP